MTEPNLDSIRFDTDGFQPEGDSEDGRTRVWFTPSGDGIGLFHFDIPPDLPTSAHTIEDLRAYYVSLMGEGMELVDLDVLQVDSCSSVWLIMKANQDPSGMTYVLSLTIPFRDFSYVLKIQAEERGTTGVREALLLDRGLAVGELRPGEGGEIVGAWDPDNEIHDTEFPDHPLSRARMTMRRIVPTLLVSPALKSCPRFPLPDGQ